METDYGIDANEEVVLITSKGEAVAIGISVTSTLMMTTMNHGPVARVKRWYVSAYAQSRYIR